MSTIFTLMVFNSTTFKQHIWYIYQSLKLIATMLDMWQLPPFLIGTIWSINQPILLFLPYNVLNIIFPFGSNLYKFLFLPSIGMAHSQTIFIISLILYFCFLFMWCTYLSCRKIMYIDIFTTLTQLSIKNSWKWIND